ncbi:hypothetical protein MMC07_006156 [Pseudocyphellaria aurata]|nr:hypothetical protein [Pseudocyphellaria aurata]
MNTSKELIDDLRDIADGLNNYLPVKTEVQNPTAKDDIASINDSPNVRLVEVACEEEYLNWSANASAVIEVSKTKSGRVDGRNVDEWL